MGSDSGVLGFCGGWQGGGPFLGGPSDCPVGSKQCYVLSHKKQNSDKTARSRVGVHD